MSYIHFEAKPQSNIALSPFGYWPRRSQVWRSKLRILLKIKYLFY